MIDHNYFNALFQVETPPHDRYDDNGQTVIHRFVEQTYYKLSGDGGDRWKQQTPIDCLFDSFAHLQYYMEALGNAFSLQSIKALLS